jgi:hypothetical protein
MTGQAVPKPQADEETEKDILASISATLDEHLGDIAYQLSRIADQLELVTGKIPVSHYSDGDDKGFIRVVNIE